VVTCLFALQHSATLRHRACPRANTTPVRSLQCPVPDRLAFRFDLLPEAVQGFIFAVVPTRQAKCLKHNYDDLRLLTKT
jgi:hypothetical protein